MKDIPTQERAAAPAPAKAVPPANYLDLYGLSKPPFGGMVDSGGYMLFGSHRRAFELVVDHIVNGTGAVVLQGEAGIGKTEMLRSAAVVAGESGMRTIIITRPPKGRLNFAQFTSVLLGQSSTDKTTHDDAIARFSAPPRKALLVDDVDLIPADCANLLLSLANHPDAGSVIVSSSTDLTADPALSPFAAAARNTIRVGRLGPAEVRQYIERSLWVAGGATRRLITPEAIKILTIRSGGVPALVNRLMEAAFTAGFARGDAMITAKTVAAAMGPVARRPSQRPSVEPAVGGRAWQMVAAGLFVVGVAVFLYRGLTGPVEQPLQHAVTVTTPKAAPKQAAHPPQPATLSPELMAALLKRGDQSLGLGDIAAARLLFQRAAEAGNALAASALAKTYDPNYAAQAGAADPTLAASWYRKAILLGDPHAAELLQHLGAR